MRKMEELKYIKWIDLCLLVIIVAGMVFYEINGKLHHAPQEKTAVFCLDEKGETNETEQDARTEWVESEIFF